ncbi:MAG: hypothetical protein HQK53_09005 [Oligoflexia bacterium]|nr:hypothetical protein [Oligoflexia bacterium]
MILETFKDIIIVSSNREFMRIMVPIIKNVGCNPTTAIEFSDILPVLSISPPHLLIVDLSEINSDSDSDSDRDQKEILNFLKTRKSNSHLHKIPCFFHLHSSQKILAEKLVAYRADELLTSPLNSAILNNLIKKYLVNEENIRTIKYSSTNMPEIQIEVSGEIKKISEIAMIIDSPVKFREQEKIEISGRLLNDLELSVNSQYSNLHGPKYIERKKYRSKIMLSGVQENSLQLIRRYGWKKNDSR